MQRLLTTHRNGDPINHRYIRKDGGKKGRKGGKEGEREEERKVGLTEGGTVVKATDNSFLMTVEVSVR